MTPCSVAESLSGSRADDRDVRHFQWQPEELHPMAIASPLVDNHPRASETKMTHESEGLVKSPTGVDVVLSTRGDGRAGRAGPVVEQLSTPARDQGLANVMESDGNGQPFVTATIRTVGRASRRPPRDQGLADAMESDGNGQPSGQSAVFVGGHPEARGIGRRHGERWQRAAVGTVGRLCRRPPRGQRDWQTP
ncbi:hypothetical protein DCS_01750 [Drechmeria coniospora]|uniref:Uncharacterized protein n=1 Tax=Drechmeria coniospora TaxID=98403 RepID=A0A151GU83_DRECN|nr:hypothetical protein DCS_01750 [Drechmeria coniospora]KYK60613.1 hypothetical protein DCS_01750 [Drechmeria coniospora]